jgi:uncharacterized protein (DUF1697 family)
LLQESHFTMPTQAALTKYVALLRAVNVGGTGKLAMADLKALCSTLKFTNVQTYLASGNVVFDASGRAEAVQSALEKALAAFASKPVGVLIRQGPELAGVVERNPYSKAPSNRVLVFFLDSEVTASALGDVTSRTDEQLSLPLGTKTSREVFVFYPNGQGRSRLKLPFASAGTGRNMNTVAALAKMAAG